MELEIRPITSEETEEFIRADSLAFGHVASEEDLAVHPGVGELARSLAAFSGGRIVGGSRTRSFRMRVPGGELPTAAIIDVSVQPTHRRQGIMTQLIADQLNGARELGEPLAALTASESIIYGRFGFGVGVIHERWDIDRPHTAYAANHKRSGSLELVGPAEMRAAFPAVYRRATALRPGAIERSAESWDWIVTDHPPYRGGGSAYFHVAFHGDSGDLDGYARYRLKDGAVMVEELVSVTDDAHAALWRLCFDVDLTSSTQAGQRPVDDPLPWMLADPRRLKRSPYDGLWVRLVDVPAALAGRTYLREGRIVFELRDSFCPWNQGRYVLEGGPEGAGCRLTKAEPDLALSASDLAAAYLGAVSFTTLSHAGRVEQMSDGSLLKADSMFATELKPWCPYSF